jgi:hypothetical protein
MILALTLAVTVAAPARLSPVDEAKRDPSLVAFRARLLQAVRDRDGATLLKYVAADVRTSFGEGGGLAAFRRQWKLPSRTSPLWAELGKVLRHGGAFREGSFWAPYVYAKWPEKVDPFEHFAVVTEDEPLRATPKGRVVARLDYAVVKNAPGRGAFRPGWRRVSAVGGPAGFVRDEALMSPIGYRANFAKQNGQWKLTAFVAGD